MFSLLKHGCPLCGWLYFSTESFGSFHDGIGFICSLGSQGVALGPWASLWVIASISREAVYSWKKHLQERLTSKKEFLLFSPPFMNLHFPPFINRAFRLRYCWKITIYSLRYQMSINSIWLKHWFMFWKWVIFHLATEYFTFHFKEKNQFTVNIIFPLNIFTHSTSWIQGLWNYLIHFLNKIYLGDISAQCTS